MTDDFDVSLRRRLESLASAVPVAQPGEVTAVARQPVRARSTSRLALAGLLPVLAVVVIGGIVAGVLKVGPGPGDSSAGSTDAANGPIESTTRTGDFELTIRSAKARYAVDELIEIEGALTYTGPNASVEMIHALGASGTPIGFGIDEPVVGEHRLAPLWETACVRSTLASGQPLLVPFGKKAEWSGFDPAFRDFVLDPALRLTDGTWHVYAVAEFMLGDCLPGATPDPRSGPEDSRIEMRVDLAIEVTGTLAPINGPVVATDSNGDFELTLTADKAQYLVDEPIEVEASLTYRGDEPVTIWHGYGAAQSPIGFGIEEPVLGGLVLHPITQEICAGTILEPGQPLTVPFGKAFRFDPDDPREDVYRAFGQDPVLALSEGTWHVYAVAGFFINTCSPDPIEMRVELTIEVTAPASVQSPAPQPSNGAAIALMTTSEPAIGCYQKYNEGHLARHPETGLGIVIEGSDTGVVWPFGYTAEEWDGVATLYDAEGEVVGREGEVVGFPGPGPGVDGLIHACDDTLTRIELLTADAPAESCRMALGGGRLMADPVSGVGVEGQDGASQPVMWPNRWTGWQVGDEVVLFDADGRLVARSGDVMRFAGGLVEDFFYACSEIRVLAHAPVGDVDPSWTQIELLTASRPNTSGLCLTAMVGGRLAADPTSGIGFERPDGTTTVVQWPYGWTGWRDGDDLVLLGADGVIVGRLGDSTSFAGGSAGERDEVASICVPFEGY